MLPFPACMAFDSLLGKQDTREMNAHDPITAAGRGQPLSVRLFVLPSISPSPVIIYCDTCMIFFRAILPSI